MFEINVQFEITAVQFAISGVQVKLLDAQA